jgi:serine/threonine-protein kinase HipA
VSVELPERALVSLNEVLVGVLQRRGESSRFEPAEAWADLPAGERPVLGQQFEEDPFSAHRSRYGAPVWFEHLLPEQGGPLREAIARSLNLAPARSFPLLLALGEDLPGAVKIRPLDATGAPMTVARRERDTVESHPDAGESLPLRISLAGVQFKISARMGKRGIAVPASSGIGDWILKFADQRFPTLAVNEFVTMTWAGAAGIDVPEIRLLDPDSVQGVDKLVVNPGDHIFAIRRYDRTDEGRVHQEDFAQVLGLPPGDAKYTGTNIDTLVSVISRVTPADLDELLSRLTFCLLCGNDDAHAKNWSLWYPGGTSARLSPAYDLVSTIEFLPDNDMSLKVAGARRFADVDRARFQRLAQRTGLDVSHVDEVVVDAVRRQVEAWQGIRETPQMTDALRAIIDERLPTLPLVRQCLS